MQVGALSVALGLTMSPSWSQGEKKINSMTSHFNRVGAVVAGVFGAKVLGKALLGFNEDVETAKTQIASMFAMTKQTSVAGELENAGKLYDMLRIKAQTLPGETKDYVNMLELLAQPMAKAKLSLEDMRDITAGAFVTSKAMGDTWQAAGRDIGDFINFGKINKVDRYLRKMLQPYGIDATDEGRKKASGMTLEQRAALIKKSLTSPQAMEMQGALGKTFEGRLETVKDNIKMIFGRIGEALFGRVKESLDKLANWFTNNQSTINAWAEKVGGYIASVFDTIGEVVSWLMDHQDILFSFLAGLAALFAVMAINATIAWLAVGWPIVAGAALFYALLKLNEYFGLLPTVLIGVAAAAVIMWLAVGGPVTIAILAFAAFAVSLYAWRDEIVEIFDQVKEAASTTWKWLNRIPIVSNLIGAGKFVAGAVTGDSDAALGGLKQSALGSFNPDAWRDPTRNDSGGSDLQGDFQNAITVNSPTTVNINTQDVAGAKDAFEKLNQSKMEADMRKAHANLGGRP